MIMKVNSSKYMVDNGPYTVEKFDGCPHCGNGDEWIVVDPNDVGSSQSWMDEEDAVCFARAMNTAYAFGATKESVKPVAMPSNPDRDPRKDPRAGDVLSVFDVEYKIVQVVHDMDSGLNICTTCDGDFDKFNIREFVKIFRSAEVIFKV